MSSSELSFSIVIPSKNVDNLKACIGAIRSAGEMARIIVVWDGPDQGPFIDWGTFPSEHGRGCKFHWGAKPFIFSRNANIGIRAAGTDDVVLMNDDVLLPTVGVPVLSKMIEAEGAAAFGLISPMVSGPAALIHRYPDDEILASRRRHGLFNDVGSRWPIPFVCVYIRRAVLDAVGPLDERFAPGSFEDNDYCLRILHAGFHMAVYNGLAVDHHTLPHTFRPAGKPDLYDYATNKARYTDKWKGEV
jgi:GT2 family glycosyltransferase